MNSKVTVFNNVFLFKEPKFVDIDYVLLKIKEESCIAQISKIREEKDKSTRNELKKKLPCILFSGEFSERNDNKMLKHSGIICIDFDGFEDDVELSNYRDKIISDDYTYSVFISPSGDGLKVLVKVPSEIENHRLYFNCLKEHYKSKYFDESCVNESRVCYMSSDPTIYINENSIVFNKKCEPKAIVKTEYKINNVIDNNKVITGLHKWWSERYGLVEGERNRNVYILSMAFNEFGIPEVEARGFMIQFSHQGFDNNEIISCVESAYRKSHLFNTKSFTDDIKLDVYTPNSVEIKDDVNINFKNIYDSSFVDVKKKIEYPPVAISIGDQVMGSKILPIPFGTYGNFSCIVGASKSKKTFLKSMLVASYIGGNTNQFASSIRSHRDRECFVIDIDSEQSGWHAQSVFKRVMKMVGQDDYEFYKPFALRPYEPKQRLEFIEWLIYESDMKDNIGLISIDGLADLVDDFNDLKESQKVVQKVMKWTSDKNFHLTTILHSNYGSDKAVGHMGSSVLKKAETVCTVKNNGDFVTASFTHTRGFPIADFDYTVNHMGIPYIIGDYNENETIITKTISENDVIKDLPLTFVASADDAFDIDSVPF